MKTNLSKKVSQILEACKSSQSKTLDLSSCELTIIPKEIRKLTWLTRLDLYDNQISKIENLDKLPSLTELNLNYNPISSIPSSLILLEKFERLHLSKDIIAKSEINKLAYLFPNCMVHLKE